jgi:tricorn protease
VFWIDRTGDGNFTRFKPTDGNLTAPMWIGERIYFVSDHEGIANLYSCLPDGSDLRKHTHHTEYYVRYPSTDGKRIVYHAGADLYVLDLATGEDRMIPVELRSPRTQAQRKFVETDKYLQEYALHPQGHSLLLTVRGKPFVMGNWEGAVIQHGEPQGVRYRLSQFLPDGERIITVSDASGEPRLELHTPDGVTRYESLDIGHPYQIAVCPTADRVALTNHRMELLVFDLATESLKLVDRAEAEWWGRSGLGALPGRRADAGWRTASPPTSARTSSRFMTPRRATFTPSRTQSSAMCRLRGIPTARCCISCPIATTTPCPTTCSTSWRSRWACA